MSLSRRLTLGFAGILAAVHALACGAPDPGAVDLSAAIAHGSDRPDPGSAAGTAGTEAQPTAGTAGTGATNPTGPGAGSAGTAGASGTAGTNGEVDGGAAGTGGTSGTPADASTPEVVVPSAPTLTSFSPTLAATGGATFMLAAQGQNFDSTCALLFGANVLATSFVSSTALSASVSSTMINVAGTVPITVRCGAIASSAPTLFTIEGPPPTPQMVGIAPSSVPRGTATFTLKVSGASFVPTSQVIVFNQNVTTTYVSSSTLFATIPANFLTQAGSGPVYVRTLSGAQQLSSAYVLLSVTN